MTRKERGFVIEGIAFALTSLCLLFVVPSLISIRDNFAVLIAGIMVIGMIGWALYFIYRMERDLK